MGFPAVIIVTTILTIGLIFGVYKIFLDKPAPQTLNSEQASSGVGQVPQAPRNPEASEALPKPSPIPSTKTSPSPTPKGIIGSLTVLQNSVSGQSTAAGSSTISGTIDVMGTPPSGTSLVIVARKSGTSDQFMTVVDGINPTDNQSWAWNTAQNGISYDLLAVLKGSSNGVNTDYAKSQTYTIKSPAYLQILTIDVGYMLAAPSGTITINCTKHNSDNTWAATVNFPQVTGAVMYQLQIGTTSGGNDLANTAKNAQTLDITANDSVNYYARYAVAVVSNPTDAQYSAFSNPATVKCP